MGLAVNGGRSDGNASLEAFILAGGASSRMGTDKALLAMDGMTLLERTARILQQVAGHVTVIGPPERYANLGLPVIADRVQNCGPLGGVFTALANTNSEWNFIVGCDMPGLRAEPLREMANFALRSAVSNKAKCVVARDTAGNLHPLLAIYHRSANPILEQAIQDKVFKMHDLMARLQAQPFLLEDPQVLRNVNTPEEWSAR